MTFVQVIEYKTPHPDKLNEIMDQWLTATQGKRTATHAVLTSDRDRPGTYMEFVEFPSYDDAMRNSALPETGKFAQQITNLCSEPPIFHNLEVVRDEKL